MKDLQLGMVEAKFAELIWENEPISTRDLIKVCKENLNWQRTTTYTVLKRLCEKGIFKCEDSIITSLISKNEFHAIQSEQFIDENFKGSLPAFITAFTSRKKISAKEIEEIQRMIDAFKE